MGYMDTELGAPSAAFRMADIRNKRPTRRRAVAVGELHVGPVAYRMIAERRLPKGDALLLAEVAGLQGAKSAPMLMPLCHPLQLELVHVRCECVPDRKVIRVYCECATQAATGVEMEALAGVNAALLTLYDLTKPIDPALSMGGVRLLFKEGGKRGLWLHPAGMTDTEQRTYRPRDAERIEGVRCAVVTLSDRASRGDYEDISGPVLVQGLRDLGADVEDIAVLPDGVELLSAHLRGLAARGVRLCLCTGGTGLGPRDLTPEALYKVADRDVPGLAEMLRSMSAGHTPLAWLSRADAVQVAGMLTLALPGSPKAAAQCMDIIAPVIAHALRMMTEAGSHD